MKRTNSLIRLFFAGCMVATLAGCSSTGLLGQKGTHASSTVTKPSKHGSFTQGVTDPEVLAVIKSGKIKGTAKQISALLKTDTLHYKTNAYAVTPDDYPVLDAIAVSMQTPYMKGASLMIEGHTDERGTRSYNMALGLRRASSVEQYLQAKGVQPQQMKVISYGFEKPVDNASNPAAWAQNRRAHLVFKNIRSVHHS